MCPVASFCPGGSIAPTTCEGEVCSVGECTFSLSPGDYHTCMVLDDGSVKCWGTNGYGQLGYGDTRNRGDDQNEMGDNLSTVDLGAGRRAVAVTAGYQHTCAVLADGSVKCWGMNDSGQLGYGDDRNRGDELNEMGDNLSTVDLGGGRRAVAITAGLLHTCVVLDDGSVKCWGDSTYGQLGFWELSNIGDDQNGMGDNLPAVVLGTGRRAVAVTAGQHHTCVLLDNGGVKCWGEGNRGQLGYGGQWDVLDVRDILPEVDLGPGRRAVAVTAGLHHTCVLLDDGSVKCWGYNIYGQLGYGDDIMRGDGADEMGANLPAVDLGLDRTAVSISAGGFFTCALLDDGSVKCWGQNIRGQLGQGDTEERGDGANEMGANLHAVNLGPGRTAVSVSACNHHTCAVLDDWSVKCWGWNGNGQLGQGDTENRGDGTDEMGDNLRPVSVQVCARSCVPQNSSTLPSSSQGQVKVWEKSSTLTGPKKRSWLSSATRFFAGGPSVRSRAGCVEVYGKVYCFGGESSQGSLADLWVLDLLGREWTDLSPLAAASVITPSARQAHGMASVDGVVVVFGGYQYQGSPQEPLRVELFDDTWFFDTRSGIWSNVGYAAGRAPPGTSDRRLASAQTECGDALVFLFGGHEASPGGNGYTGSGHFPQRLLLKHL